MPREPGTIECLLDAARNVLAFDQVRGGAQIVDARIGAGADEHAVDGNVDDRGAGFESHVDRARARWLSGR